MKCAVNVEFDLDDSRDAVINNERLDINQPLLDKKLGVPLNWNTTMRF